MTKLITNNFRTWMARLFVRKFSDTTTYAPIADSTKKYVFDNYVVPDYVEEIISADPNDTVMVPDFGYFYVFAGSSNTTLDASVVSSHYNIYDGMLFGKRALSTDVSLMIDKHFWSPNTIYDIYDSADPCLHLRNFFVTVPEGDNFNVFICLDNNNRALSTSEVTKINNTSSDYFRLPDGYIWSFLFSISNEDYYKFATGDFIPLTRNSAESVKESGSIISYTVTDIGFNQNTYLEGYISQTFVNNSSSTFSLNLVGSDLFDKSNYYVGCGLYISDGTGKGQLRTITKSYLSSDSKKIVEVNEPFTVPLNSTSKFIISPGVVVEGDGTGATARTIMKDETVLQVVPVSFGTGYSYANVTINSSVGIVLNGVYTNEGKVATAKSIISPPTGHGWDLINELFADKVCVSVDFIRDDHPLQTYNQYGLIVNPLFKRVVLTLDDITGYNTGEILVQEITSSYGKIESINTTTNEVVLARVKGEFVSGFDVFGSYNSFSAKVITAPDLSKFVISDLVDNSGEILVIRNDVLTTRTNDQKERIKIVIDF